MDSVYYYQMPLGEMGIRESGDAITHIFFANRREQYLGILKETPLIKEAARQLNEYFNHKRTCFDLPLHPEGTTFQCQVWQALCDIPYAETRSYGEIAAAIGKAKACRAVGQANNRNPIAIVIP